MTFLKLTLIIQIIIIGIVLGETVNLTSPSTPTDIALFNNRIYISTFGGGIVELDSDLDYIRTITSADGLGVNIVQSLFSTEDKLWYGTIEGVGYIDEDDKPIYIYAPGNYRFIDVNNICEHKDDVWFATCEGALRYNKLFNSWHLHFSEDEAILNDIYSIINIDERVYFGGVDRIFWYDYAKNNWGHFDLTQTYSCIYVNDIAELYGKVLIATTNGLYEYIPAENKLNHPLLNIKDDVGCIYNNGSDVIFGLRGSLIKLNIESGRALKIKLTGDIRENELIKGIEEIGDRVIIISDMGVYELDNNKIKKINLEDNLIGPCVYDIEAIEDNIFITTINGLIKLNNSKTKNILPTKKIDPTQCVGIINNKIAVGRKTGLYILDDNDNPLYIKMPFVNDILNYNSYSYIATIGGIYVIDQINNITAIIDVSSGLPNNRISDIVVYKGMIYTATLGGGLAIINPQDLSVIKTPDILKNIDSDYIFSLYAYSDLLFIGTWDRGLFIYDGVDMKNITWGDGLRHTDIWAMDLYYPYLFLSVRGCGIDVYDIERDVVRGYVSSWDGLGSDYIRCVKVIDDKVLFGSAGRLAIMNINDIISLLEVAN